MSDNTIIFAAVAPMLDERGFNDAGRKRCLDQACARYLASDVGAKSIIFETVKPWLDPLKFNAPGRIDTLNAACDHFRLAAALAAVPGTGDTVKRAALAAMAAG